MILSGFKDSNGISIDLFEYLSLLENRIKSLKQQISGTGRMYKVIILKFW